MASRKILVFALIVLMCAFGIVSGYAEGDVAPAELITEVSDVKEDSLAIGAGHASKVALDNVQCDELVVEAAYRGIIKITKSNIQNLIVHGSVEGKDEEVVIMLGASAIIARLEVYGNVRVIMEQASAKVDDIFVSGEHAKAKLQGKFPSVTVEADATVFIGFGAKVESMTLEAGAAARIRDGGSVSVLHVSPIENMADDPAYIAVDNGAKLGSVYAAGMLDIGLEGAVEHVETALDEEYSYDDEAENKVVVNIFEDIRNESGDTPRLVKEIEQTEINHLGREYFTEREREVFGDLDDQDGADKIALNTPFDIGSLEDIQYNGTTVRTMSVALEGVAEGDDVSCTAIISYDTKDAGTGKRMTVTYVLTGADADKYTAPAPMSAEGVTIKRRPLYMSFDSVVPRDYIPNDATVALEKFRVTSFASGDHVYVSSKTLHGLLDDPDVGVDKPVTFNHMRLYGADAQNYYLVFPKVDEYTVSISRAEQPKLEIVGMDATFDPDAPCPLPIVGGGGEGELTYAIVGGTGSGSIVNGKLVVSAAGTFDIKVSKKGDGNYLDAESEIVTITIDKAEQNALSIDGEGTFDYDPTANRKLPVDGGSGTGAVTYEIVGGTGKGRIVNGELVVDECGTFNIKAMKAGDGLYNPIESEPITITVNKIDQAALDISGASDYTYNPNAPYMLTTTGGSGTGAIVYENFDVDAECVISGTTLTATKAGGTVITAVKAGDGHYNDVMSEPFGLTIKKANQAALTFSSPNDITYSTRANFHQVTATGGTTDNPIVLTQVDSYDVGSLLNDRITTHKSGVINIKAFKAGNDLYEDIEGVQALTVNKAPQMTLTFAGNNSYFSSTPYQLSYSGGSGEGEVSYQIMTGGTGAGDISGSKLTITKAGTFPIQVTKEADDCYLAAVSEIATITINKGAQAPLTTEGVGTTYPYDANGVQILLNGGSGTGALTYQLVSGGTGVGTINPSTGVLSVTKPGTFVIKATKAGDACCDPIDLTFTVTITKGEQAALVLSSTATNNEIPFNMFGTNTTSLSAQGGSVGTYSYSIVSGGDKATLNGTQLSISELEHSVQVKATRSGNDLYNPVDSNVVTITTVYTNPTLSITLNNGGNVLSGVNTTSGSKICSVTPTIAASVPLKNVEYAVVRTSSNGGYTSKSNISPSNLVGYMGCHVGSYTVYYKITDQRDNTALASGNMTVTNTVTATGVAQTGISGHNITFTYDGAPHLIIASYSYFFKTAPSHNGSDNWAVWAGTTPNNRTRIANGSANAGKSGSGNGNGSWTSMQFIYNIDPSHGTQCLSSDAGYTINLALSQGIGSTDSPMQ